MHLSDFPMRLDNAPGIGLRTDNEIYKNEMKTFTTKIVNILKEAKTFKAWGGKNPYSTAKDLAFSIARFVQAGGVLNNYYMYHGGTNFGPNAGGPYITTSYDYKECLGKEKCCIVVYDATFLVQEPQGINNRPAV
ncbi:hypothetical protein GH714_028491 [Hevea brasiliensis]|uniref:beta-galactosidase n=1 Tax=Hevea brasiliensis TaxID=3981 RepID=A0A6A6LVB4_HEVBR|nr:hypothetical protein GH714_028491 [Hevea brasiliensis]